MKQKLTGPRGVLVFSSLFLFLSSQGQTPTWAEDVSCILNSHCTTCHHDGGAGHFSLTTYTDAYTNRVDIRDATQARIMPPWQPDHDYVSHAHERRLSQDEIDIIAAWVTGGAPEGDPQLAPPPPVYDSEWAIAQPDITVRMEEYVIPASTADLYRCFVMPSGNTQNRYITGIEVVPGNTEVVHHVLVFQDTSGQAQALDLADPQPGYTSFGGIGVSGAKLIGLWVPGAEPYFTPQGMGIQLLADADLVIQVHYPAGSDFQLDSTRVNIQLTSQPFVRNLAIDPILDHIFTITDGPLVIPPNQVVTFHAQFTSPLPATITAIGPHAHLLCQSMRSFAVTPQNDTIPLIDIPEWDFRWQGLYEFRRPIHLPAGTTLYGEATYDNTINNPDNPNDPPQWVFLGEATTDEMMLFYFAYTFGFPGDTAIVVDTASHTAHYLNCTPSIAIGIEESTPASTVRVFPIPAMETIQVELEQGGELRLIDHTGRTVLSRNVNGGRQAIDVSRLARGVYVTQVRTTNGETRHVKVALE